MKNDLIDDKNDSWLNDELKTTTSAIRLKIKVDQSEI